MTLIVVVIASIILMQTALRTNGPFAVGVTLYLLAKHAFYCTGHHDTLAAINWPSGLTGLTTVHFWLSGNKEKNSCEARFVLFALLFHSVGF